MTERTAGRFDGEVVLVTGSVRGIGAAIARAFGQEGASVVVTGLPTHAARGRAVAEAISEGEGDARFLGADLSEEAAVDDLVDGSASAYGSIDHVVNNAAVVHTESARACSVDDWESLMRVNLRAYWLVARAALAHMDAGTVTNVSSIHATSTTPAAFPYSVSKAGVAGLTRSLAIDFGPDVRVNSVEPGQIVVERNESRVREQPDDVADAYPLERLGEVEDVAGAVTFLASDAAAFLTGVNLPVDGGLHCVQPVYWRDS